jgi:hypothetical protein
MWFFYLYIPLQLFKMEDKVYVDGTKLNLPFSILVLLKGTKTGVD